MYFFCAFFCVGSTTIIPWKLMYKQVLCPREWIGKQIFFGYIMCKLWWIDIEPSSFFVFPTLGPLFCILNYNRFYSRWMYSQLEISQKNCDKFYFKMYDQSYDLLWIELWQVLFQVNVFSIKNFSKKKFNWWRILFQMSL